MGLVGAKRFSGALQEMKGKILARYAHNPYVLIGCEEECANTLTRACEQCEAGRRVLKVVMIGTQAYLDALDVGRLERLAHYGVQMEFFMQVERASASSALCKYGSVFGFKNAKSQPEHF